MNNCLFVAEHNLYVISVVAPKGTSEVQIYSFRQTGLIQDQFVLKSNQQSERNSEAIPESDEGGQATSRPSITDMLESPNGSNVLMSRKNTLFSSIPDSKDPLSQEQIRVEKPNGAVRSTDSTSSSASKQQAGGNNNWRVQSEAINSKRSLPLDMLLARQNYSFKVKALTYCNNLDLLSVGLSNGMIVNYTFEIQSRMEESKNSFYKKEPTTESKPNSNIKFTFRN